jgi:alpha-D-ribose 1-methylphosphonate 5-triphosphate synthase subunit PhnH
MTSAPALRHWKHGFDDPALGSQQTFRAILDAMGHPGQLITIRENPCAPDVFNSASAAACLTLLDYETPVWTDIDWRSPAISWLQFVCGSSVVTEPCMANFAIITQPATMPPLDYFRIGRYEYPDKATTIVVQVDDIYPGTDKKYSNIFVNKTARLEIKGVTENFWYQWQQLSSRHPLGIDIFFTCDDVLTVLPKIKGDTHEFKPNGRGSSPRKKISISI